MSCRNLQVLPKHCYLWCRPLHQLTTSPHKSSFVVVNKDGSTIVCFNCGGAHHLRDCPEPRNEDKINFNRDKHPNGRQFTCGQPTEFRGRPDFSKPKDGETHRLITVKGNSATYVYNPTTKRWDLPTTTSIDSASKALVAPPGSINVKADQETLDTILSDDSESEEDKAQKKLNLAYIISVAQREASAL